MIDALISGKLIKSPSLRTGKSGKNYVHFLLRVHVDNGESIAISGIGFGELAEKISLLKKDDPLAVIGSLRPTEWADKETGEIRHGLSITASNSLSPYDMKKRKPKIEVSGKSDNELIEASEPVNEQDFDDEIPF